MKVKILKSPWEIAVGKTGTVIEKELMGKHCPGQYYYWVEFEDVDFSRYYNDEINYPHRSYFFSWEVEELT